MLDLLKDIWKERLTLYEENLDLQQWKREATTLDSWLNEKENMLSEDWRKVESADDANDKLRWFFACAWIAVSSETFVLFDRNEQTGLQKTPKNDSKKYGQLNRLRNLAFRDQFFSSKVTYKSKSLSPVCTPLVFFLTETCSPIEVLEDF